MICILLALLGLALGSFVNALVWRLHLQEISKKPKGKKYSIANGRSMCVHCNHELAVRDLIPVFSWVFLRGKCRYCAKPISYQYPIVELMTAALFVISYIFWPNDLTILANQVLFISWLLSLVGLIALFIYDLKYLILPNKIVFPIFAIALLGVVLNSLVLSSLEPTKNAFLGMLVGGGIFYILFQLSEGKWIGGGDVKLGFALGILVGGAVEAFLVIFIASFIGTIFALPLLVKNDLKTKSKVAFGPFLIISTVIVKLFGNNLSDWYNKTFIL